MVTAVPGILNYPQRDAEDTVSFRLAAQIVPFEAAESCSSRAFIHKLGASAPFMQTPGERGDGRRHVLPEWADTLCGSSLGACGTR